MIDEAHERKLNTDLLLALLRTAFADPLNRPPHFRLVVSSATLDAAKFSAFFFAAPVIRVSGAPFPVQVVYHPISSTADSSRADNSRADGAAAAAGAGAAASYSPKPRELSSLRTSRVLSHQLPLCLCCKSIKNLIVNSRNSQLIVLY